jgi:hypothetical protein
MASLTWQNRLKLTIEAKAVSAKRTCGATSWRAAQAILPSNSLPMEVVVGESRLSTEAESPGLSSVWRLTDAYIEPKYGFALQRPAVLRADSITHGGRVWSVQGREWIGVPSLVAFLCTARAQVVREGSAVSLLSPWPLNYYHFILDVMPKLELLSTTFPHLLAHPLYISNELFSSPFFASARSSTALKHFNFRPLPTSAYLRCEELFYVSCSGAEGSASRLQRVRDILSPSFQLDRPSPRRIFVTRSAYRGRAITNHESVHKVFDKYNFAVLDFDDVSFVDQVQLVKNCEIFSAIHGASFANMIFCEHRSTHIFEIHPPTEDNDCFKSLAETLGFEFSRVKGDAKGEYFDKRGDFSIDPERLESALASVCGSTF